MNNTESQVQQGYEYAKQAYGQFGVDTDAAIQQLQRIPISLHCWQGDDVTGFETKDEGLSAGGIMATGSYPGRARNADELRQDLEQALRLIPGNHRVNLHAIYGETGGKVVDRTEIATEHFSNWIAWAKKQGLGIDFNPTFFAHPKAESGYTLASKDKDIRKFWITHGQRCRQIAADIGQALGTPTVNNIWIPDGSKDLPADRLGHRQLLVDALDEILETPYDKEFLLDSVECKLFGLGSESYVVGSHEFYMGYALSRNVMLCLDAGHFHPTEGIADKVSSLLTFSDRLLLHVSRGVRWDSDHVVILNDDLLALTHELSRCQAYNRVHFGLDFFDASINRIAAWVTGTRAALKAILISLLEPTKLLCEAEASGKLGHRLALMEEFKSLPYGAVWNKYCLDQQTPVGNYWLDEIDQYERQVLHRRAEHGK